MFTRFFKWLFRRKPKAAPATVLPTAQTVAPMPPVNAPRASYVVTEEPYVPVDDGIDILDVIETVVVAEAIIEEEREEQSYYDNGGSDYSDNSGGFGDF